MSHEQNLLQESATREADLTERLVELETEGRGMRQEVSRLRVENERLHSRYAETVVSMDTFEKERKELKENLREIKFREKRLLRDYSELEEENIAMQKQVSQSFLVMYCLRFFLLLLLSRRDASFEQTMKLGGQLCTVYEQCGTFPVHWPS